MITTATGQSDWDRLLAGGCYLLRDVRRLASVPEGVSRRFVRNYKGERGLWGGGNQRLGGRYYATFRDLMELRMINAFYSVGLRWPVIVRAAIYGQERFGTDYPFSDRRFQTDGGEIFDRGIVGLEQVSGRGQLAFEQLVGPSLFVPLDYLDDAPVRWYPAEEWGNKLIGRGVVVDPRRSFGVPVVADSYVPTDTLYRNFIAEGKDAALVARSYEIPVEAVLQAVAFEEAAARR